ncbi:putative nucleoporin Nup54 [Frankliniella fusca]|uniref:Nucleoporin Nup54 n=1 Tax=Frankliniella fusca TaxID=407009 RepID=A0AAE1HWJ5_9NEOP|nr:putative nucleoporin Nup54 [Frankliniella fusca]
MEIVGGVSVEEHCSVDRCCTGTACAPGLPGPPWAGLGAPLACAPPYVCCSEAGELWCRGWLTGSPLGVTVAPAAPAPAAAATETPASELANAESAEFSRLCDTDGDLEPVDGGVKNELGSLRMCIGFCRGRFELGLSTISNRACSSDSRKVVKTVLERVQRNENSAENFGAGYFSRQALITFTL